MKSDRWMLTQKSDVLTSSSCLTLSLSSPAFYVFAEQVFWKHWGEKEKLLLTSNFYFSRSVFYLFGEFSAIFIKYEIAVCKLFQFGRV